MAKAVGKIWEKLRQKAWQWRGVLMTVPVVAGAVIGLRHLGLLQPLEFPLLDQFFLLRPQEPVDPRIVIVEINEADVQKVKQWPMSDAKLAELLGLIRKQKPAAIGLDLYRDLPVQPGHEALTQVFKTTPNLIAVQKVVTSLDSSAVAPPKVLKDLNQVGANDLVLDADGKIRRANLSLLDKSTGEDVLSFGFLLAATYLTQKNNIQIELTPDNLVKAGSVTFPAFSPNDGGYVRADAGGYQVILNYRGEVQRFKSVTMTEVLEKRIPPNMLHDRIVLLGATAESLKDLFYVPYSSSLTTATRMPGVYIHANFVSQILSAVLDKRPPTLKTWSEPVEWLWILSWATVGAVLTWTQRHSDRQLLRVLTIFAAAGCLAGGSYLAFTGSWWIPVVPPLIALAGSSIAVNSYVAFSAADMRRTFGRYLTDEVVASLLESPTGLKLGGERRKVTIMLSDLRGFSAVSERLPPEQVVTILNLYLGTMSDIISQYHGTINEFIGDGIFVMFGAPVYRNDDSERAIACAVAMQAAMDSVNAQNQQLGLPKLEMGIGIDTGEVVVGNIGSQKRAKYTVVGNHVNLAARIESYTVGQQILISENTYRDAGPEIIKIGGQLQVEPKGFKKPITIYEVAGVGGKYNLFLPKAKEEFIALHTALPVQYTVLEGKHLVGTVFDGCFVRLSEGGAELWSDHFLTPLSNLKITLLLPTNNASEFDDLYAKVLDKPAETEGCFRLRFTSKSPEATAALDRLRQEAIEKASV
jgi:adenylate cyclase